MEIKINLDEEKIREMVEEQIAEAITSQYGKMASDKKIGLRSGIEKAVKSYIYEWEEKDCFLRQQGQGACGIDAEYPIEGMEVEDECTI